MEQGDNRRSKVRVTKFGRWRWFVTGVGLLVALGVLVADVVRSGASAGIGPLQWMVSGLALGIAVLPWLRFSFWGKIALVAGSFVVMFALLELVLALLGYEIGYEAIEMTETATLYPLNICEDPGGCHFNVEFANEICTPDDVTRSCMLNSSGFSSDLEFTQEAIAADDSAYRILLLGDSFTWGSSAEIGRDWASTLTRELNDTLAGGVLVWNASHPGTGTRNAIATARKYLPIMQPDLVILGFYDANDFADNLYPLDRFTFVNDGVLVQQYSRVHGEAIKEPLQILHYRAQGYDVSSHMSWEARIGQQLERTRFGTLIVGAISHFYFNSINRDITEDLLQDLDSLINDSGAQFVILGIPNEINLTTNEPTNYTLLREIVAEQDIAFLDTLPILQTSDYDNERPEDDHWNTQGHERVGLWMSACVAHLLVNDTESCPLMRETAP